MTDRRRSDEYKQVSGYVPQELARAFKSICAGEGMSQSDALEEMLYEWVAKKTGSTSLACDQDTPRTFADLVRVNMTKLKRCGVRNLQALAKGEVLPTPGDFAIVISNLGIDEAEQKTIWEETFKISVEREFLSVKIYKDSGGLEQGECEYS
ncbi:MAG: ribbon-helix-helix protein, CopG family [Calothrix sp. SM1_7_51]|nr:ribbon-helix-helix protein, CopG family [Calothrix sp. SM1_7_51]